MMPWLAFHRFGARPPVHAGFRCMFAFWMGGGGFNGGGGSGTLLHALPFIATPGRMTCR